MENVLTGVTACVDLATSMLTAITGNAILCAILASGFVSIGLGILAKTKHVARA